MCHYERLTRPKKSQNSWAACWPALRQAEFGSKYIYICTTKVTRRQKLLQPSADTFYTLTRLSSMSDISKPEGVAIKQTDSEEHKQLEDESLQPQSDSHMAVKISTTFDYFSGDSQHQGDEEDGLITHDKFDTDYPTPKATGLRSRKVLITVIVVAVLLVIGAIVCKCCFSSIQSFHGWPGIQRFWPTFFFSGSVRWNDG